MNLSRILAVSVVVLSAGEALLAHWALVTFGGRGGLSATAALLAVVALCAFNFAALPWVRRRLRAKGVSLVLGRTWLLGSVAALLTGVLLAAVFAVVVGLSSLFGGEGFAVPALAWLGGAAVLLGFGSVLWGSSVGDRRVRVDRVELPAARISSRHRALRIAHVTDLHIGPLLAPERVREFVERIARTEPDIVALTGDIFDFDPLYVEDGCRALAGLAAPYGVFAILGNHDVYTGAEVVAEGLARHTGIRLLRDEWEELDVDGAPLAVAGIEDPGVGWTEKESESEALVKLALEIPAHLPSVLLAHRPAYFAHAARLGFSVVLSGHTHGGQIALPFANHYNPSRLIANRTRGVYSAEESTMYVSRGLGMAGLPLRINCPREIALIALAERAPGRSPGSPAGA